jgi:hypothetical protein
VSVRASAVAILLAALAVILAGCGHDDTTATMTPAKYERAMRAACTHYAAERKRLGTPEDDEFEAWMRRRHKANDAFLARLGTLDPPIDRAGRHAKLVRSFEQLGVLLEFDYDDPVADVEAQNKRMTSAAARITAAAKALGIPSCAVKTTATLRLAARASFDHGNQLDGPAALASGVQAPGSTTS